MLYEGYEVDNTSSIARVFVRELVSGDRTVVADFATVSEATEHIDKLNSNNNENALMISESLRALRLYHELSTEEMSKALGISKSHLSEVEHNKKTISMTLLAKYKQALDLPISVIIDFAEGIETLQQGPGMNELDYSRHKLNLIVHILRKKGKVSLPSS